MAPKVLAITLKVHNLDDVLGCFFEWLTASSSCLTEKWTVFSFALLEQRALQAGDRNEGNAKEKTKTKTKKTTIK